MKQFPGHGVLGRGWQNRYPWGLVAPSVRKKRFGTVLSVTLLLGPKLGPYSGPENVSTLWPRIRAHFLSPFFGTRGDSAPLRVSLRPMVVPKQGPENGPEFGATMWTHFRGHYMAPIWGPKVE